MTCFDLLFVNVYRCNDILPGKNYSRTILEPPKLSPVCIQYDTTDANLDLTVYSYILRCCVYPFFFFFFFYRGCLNGCYAFAVVNIQIIRSNFNVESDCSYSINTRSKKDFITHIYIYVSPLHNADLIMVNSPLADKMTVMTSDSSFY